MEKEINHIIARDCKKILEGIDTGLLKGTSILLTGANGLLGSYIAHTIYFANKFYNTNCRLYCVSLHGPNRELKCLSDDKNITFIQADLSEPFEFKEKVDFIFHAACYAQPKKFLADKFKTAYLNIGAVKTLLDLAKENKAKFMFFSSVDVYGDIPKDKLPVKESYNGDLSTLSPRAIYGESKRMGEAICAMYRADHNLKAYVVRISHLYGPGISIEDDRVLGNFIKKAFTDKKIEMLDEGASLKTFGYAADAVYMIFRIILEGKDFVYNVGGQEPFTIKGLAVEVSKNAGGIPVITPLAVSTQQHIGSDYKRVGVDISKFIDEFGAVDFVSFSEGIKRTVEWNIQEYGLERE